MTTTNEAPEPSGMLPNSVRNASSPPAEAPTADDERLRRERAGSPAVLVDCVVASLATPTPYVGIDHSVGLRYKFHAITPRRS